MTTNWFQWDEPEEAEPNVWTLRDIYDDLGTFKDVAAHLNVSEARMRAWINRDQLKNNKNCPRPVLKFAHIYIYSKQQWADWYAEFLKGKKPDTRWTSKAMGFKETRISKLDPTFKFGNKGLNNPLRDDRKAKSDAVRNRTD